MNFRPPKWGASHTEKRNIFKGLPKHLIGTKLVKDAFDDLTKKGFIIRMKKTGEEHVSLNPRMVHEISEFVKEENDDH